MAEWQRGACLYFRWEGVELPACAAGGEDCLLAVGGERKALLGLWGERARCLPASHVIECVCLCACVCMMKGDGSAMNTLTLLQNKDLLALYTCVCLYVCVCWLAGQMLMLAE